MLCFAKFYEHNNKKHLKPIERVSFCIVLYINLFIYLISALTIIPKEAAKHCDPRYVMPGCPPPHGPHLWQHNLPGFPVMRGADGPEDARARSSLVKNMDTVKHECRNVPWFLFRKKLGKIKIYYFINIL